MIYEINIKYIVILLNLKILIYISEKNILFMEEQYTDRLIYYWWKAKWINN